MEDTGKRTTVRTEDLKQEGQQNKWSHCEQKKGFIKGR